MSRPNFRLFALLAACAVLGPLQLNVYLPSLPLVQREFGASVAQVQGLLGHWERTLVEIGFLDPALPAKLMPRLNQLLNRAQLGTEEVNILRGIARTLALRK